MFLQLQKRFQRPVISLHGKAAHQLRLFAGILRGKQDVDQAVPHILRGVIIKLTGIVNLRGQRRPLDPGRDGVPVSQKLPEVRKLRILHICQPPDIPDQPVLFFLHLLRTPVKDRIPLLSRPAFPAQSLIAQRRPADGTCILKAHVYSLLLNDNHEKHAARISYGYRGSRQGLMQARTLTRCPRKKSPAPLCLRDRLAQGMKKPRL